MKNQESLPQMLLRLEESHLQPETRRSAGTMDALLADDFLEFGASGAIHDDKGQIIRALQSEPLRCLTLSDYAVRRLAPGVALATYRLLSHGETTARARHSLRSSVWQLIEGRWQLLFHQGTPAPEPKA